MKITSVRGDKRITYEVKGPHEHHMRIRVERSRYDIAKVLDDIEENLPNVGDIALDENNVLEIKGVSAIKYKVTVKVNEDGTVELDKFERFDDYDQHYYEIDVVDPLMVKDRLLDRFNTVFEKGDEPMDGEDNVDGINLPEEE